MNGFLKFLYGAVETVKFVLGFIVIFGVPILVGIGFGSSIAQNKGALIGGFVCFISAVICFVFWIGHGLEEDNQKDAERESAESAARLIAYREGLRNRAGHARLAKPRRLRRNAN